MFKPIVRRDPLNRILIIPLAVFAITQGALSAMVLCHAEDGHRAIELVHHDPCQQIGQDVAGRTDMASTPSRPTAPAGPAAVKSVLKNTMSQRPHHSGCVDIPLGHDVISHHIPFSGKSFTQLIRQALVIPISAIHSSARRTVQTAWPHHKASPPADNSLFSLRSIVLLN
jgi:hypothetical protein